MSGGGSPFGPHIGINAQDGTSTHTYEFHARTNEKLSLHLVTTGTLTGATGWELRFTNAPPLNNRIENGPDTTTFDWVATTDVTFTAPSGAATNQVVHVENVQVKWVQIRWNSSGVSGSGNVSASIMSKR